MSSIYILSDHGKLTKSDQTLVLVQKDGTRQILFPFKIEQLVLMGSVSISADAIKLLTKYKIYTTFLSSNGRFNGKLFFGDSKNVFLRQKQYRILDNKEESLKIAKSLVVGKIKNEISFMQRIKRKADSSYKDEEKILAAVNAVKNFLEDSEKAQSVDALRGYEGSAARKYFEVFGMNVHPDWADFKKRSKNPPKSNVNAVLSFLYTLLSYRVESALEASGLDICAGNLHSLNYGRNALVFDLIEEFRSPIADTLCCSLFNLGTLCEEDFETVVFDQDSLDNPIDSAEKDGAAIPDNSLEKEGDSFDGKGVLLTKAGLKKVIAAFESKMDTLILYSPTGQKISYAKIIYEQVERYKRVINGEETEYKSYYFK